MDALSAYNSDTDDSDGDISYHRLPMVNHSAPELEGDLRAAPSCKKKEPVHAGEDASDALSSALGKRSLACMEKDFFENQTTELVLQNSNSIVLSSVEGSGSGDNTRVSRSKSTAGETAGEVEASDHLHPETTGKTKTMLPLPSDLDQLHAAGPSRIRSFPHVEGNFALHLYAPVTFSAAAKLRMAGRLAAAESSFPNLKRVETGGGYDAALGADFHVSLSRPCAIRFHQIESVVGMLKNEFRGQHMYQLDFDRWQVFVNEGGTRSFLALEATGSETRGHNEFAHQVALVDSVYTQHELPTFYETPRPHISLLWTCGDARGELSSLCDRLNKAIKFSILNMASKEDVERKWASSMPQKSKRERNVVTWRAHVTQVVCKVGQREHCIWQVD